MKNKNNKIIRTLFKKELLDVLRDKKTVIMMLVVPVILYPLIFIAALGIMSFVQDNLETSTYNIVIDAEEDKDLAIQNQRKLFQDMTERFQHILENTANKLQERVKMGS